jgi:hypothetical protein
MQSLTKQIIIADVENAAAAVSQLAKHHVQLVIKPAKRKLKSDI